VQTRLAYRKALAILALATLLQSCQQDASQISILPESDDSDTAIGRIRSRAEEIGTAVLLIERDGQVVFQFGDVTREYQCHSIRKPFLGALYGIYRDRGMINLDQTLAELAIDDIPPRLTDVEKQASVRDLLLSRSGVYHEAGGEAYSMVNTRPPRGSHAPGTFFYYNNWDFNALGTIFRNVTGEDIFEVFFEQIAEPIGMEDFTPSDGTYVTEDRKSAHPSYFFRMSSRDMARFGRLYADGGMWEGNVVVPKSWIDESTTAYPVDNSFGDPYGYLWRIIPQEAGLGFGFYHTGLGVHLLAVLPEHKLVVVHRVDTDRKFDTSWPEIKGLLEMAVAELDLVGTGASAEGY